MHSLNTAHHDNTKSNVIKMNPFLDEKDSRLYVFYDLMKYKVQDILLVSPLYDAYILEEDGLLSEQIFAEYERLKLSLPPRITRVNSGKKALQLMRRQHFDVVITTRRLGDMTLEEFARRVKMITIDTPIVLLLTNQADLTALNHSASLRLIDDVFIWNGSPHIFLAIIKLIEDRVNVKNDTSVGFVRVILVVEDNIQYYSLYLPLIYEEIMKQGRKLIESEPNENRRLLKMRGRPKVLLAKSYEEALHIYHAYKDYMLGVITDVGFPKNGKKDFSAGFDLVKYMKASNPYLPILVNSTNPKNEKRAREYNVRFIFKFSKNFIHSIRDFIKNDLGFGDFTFRLPNGEKIGQARDVDELLEKISGIPDESFTFHLQYLHFVSWLLARGEHELAACFKKYRHVDNASDLQAIRKTLREDYQRIKKQRYEGIIARFTPEKFDPSIPFVKIGRGSIGGKARGLSFMQFLLTRSKWKEKYKDTIIHVPNTIVIATGYFDEFLEQNNLHEVIHANVSDDELKQRFLQAKLPTELEKALKEIITKIDKPLAIRSSSLLEDSQFQPFAGIYATYMLPNNHPDPEVRLQQLMDAVKLVYASTFSQTAKSYVKSIGQQLEIEKMAVIIQQVVGRSRNERFYPDFSGVAQSFNFYPVSYMKPEDGIAHVALGLGTMVVQGGKCLTFCPKYPRLLPQLASPKEALKSTQNEFMALRLDLQAFNLAEQGETATIETYPLTVAQEDGTLTWIGSIYDFQNERIVDGTLAVGAPLVTFASILKHGRFSLADILEDLLHECKEGFGCDVEIEFAVVLDRTRKERHRFAILQVRPLVTDFDRADIEVDTFKHQALIYTTRALGNGIITNVRDIVLVKPETFSNLKTTKIRDEVSAFNQKLGRMGKSYLLIGPGRWGTQDPFLGIPVRWNDINQAAVIVEAELENFRIDGSQGMHFFVNVTTSRKGYLTVTRDDPSSSFIDWKWLKQREAREETEHVKWISLSNPLIIRINGKQGKAVVIKPSEEIRQQGEPPA